MKILVGWLGRFSGVRNGMETAYINFGNAMRARGHEVILAYCTDSRGGVSAFPSKKE